MHMCPSINPYEPYFHLAEVMTVHMILERGIPPAPGQAPQSIGYAQGCDAPAYTTQSRSFTGQYANLPYLQRNIMDFPANQLPNDEDVHVLPIARGVHAGQIRDALGALIHDGYNHRRVSLPNCNLIGTARLYRMHNLMSFVHQLSPFWPAKGFKDIKNLVIFGDSYSSIGYDYRAPHPTPTRPLGVPYPGTELWTDTEVDNSHHPNWVGHLISKYSPGNKYSPGGSSESSILVYDYAVGGEGVAGVLRQVQSQFVPHVGKRPDWAAWSPRDTLFVSWVGINDLAYTSNPSHSLEVLFKAQEDLYEVGARNFLFIDVPPIDRSPAVLQFVGPGSDRSMPRYQKWNDGLRSSVATFASNHAEVSALYFSSHKTFSRILDEPWQHGFTAHDAEKEAGKGIWADRLHPTSKMHDFVAKDLTSFLASVVAKE